MEQGNLFYPPVREHVRDITFRRHHGNQQSEEANRRVAPFRESDEQRIEKIIREHGTKGITSTELETVLGKAKNKFSGRLSSLRADKKVYAQGTRNGCAVLIHKDFTR
jgi:hypothetical protein